MSDTHQRLSQLYGSQGADGPNLADYTMALFDIEPPSGDVAETMEQLAAYLEDTLRIDPASASTVSSQAKSIWSQSVIPNTSRMNGSGYGTHPHGSLYDRYQPTHPPGLHQNQFASPQQPRGGPISAHAPRYGYTSHQQVRAYDDPQMQQEGVYRDTQALPHHIAPPPGFDLPPIPQLSSLGHVNVSTRQAQGIPIHAPSHSQAQGLGTFYPPHSSQAQQQQQQSQAYQIQPQYAPNSGHNQSSYYSPSPPNSNSMPNSMPISIQSMNTHQQNLSRSLNSGYSNSNSNSHFSPHSYNMPGYLHHAHSQSHDNTPSQTRDYSYNVGFTIGGRMEPSSGSNNSSLSAGMYYEPPRNGTGAKKSKFAFANKESVDITDNNVFATRRFSSGAEATYSDTSLSYDETTMSPAHSEGVHLTDTVSLLEDMFPNTSVDLLRATLHDTDGDLDRAIAAILDEELTSRNIVPVSRLDTPTERMWQAEHVAQQPQPQLMKHSVLKASAQKKGRGVAWVQAEPYVPLNANEPAREEPAQPENSKAVGRVCRHWLQGQCFRANCWFSHEAEDTTCRFWLKGQCLKNDECPFTHGVSQQSWNMYKEATTPAAPPPKPPVKLTTQDFPALGMGEKIRRPKRVTTQGVVQAHTTDYTHDNTHTHTQTTIRQTQGQAQAQAESGPRAAAGGGGGDAGEPGMDMASTVKLNSLINTYKGVTPVEYIENRFEANGRDYQDTLKELSELYPAVPTNASGSQKPSWSIAGSQPAPRSTAGKGITRNDPAYDASWKSAGKDVNALYTRARGEAVGHSRLRGQYFQRAAEAYRSGNRQGAAAFSKEGRMHHDLALKLQREACELIFSSRNTRHSPEVDLHGLHVSEALELLEGLLGRAAESNEYICIITGTGRHSVQGRARLRPAVEKYLTNHGYSYTDASTDQRGGMIKVKL